MGIYYLTDKEIELIDLALKGFSRKEIATQLKVTESNVSRTISRAKEKLTKCMLTLDYAEVNKYLDFLGINKELSGHLIVGKSRES